MKSATRGFFITFEGGEGSGKSTQAALLARYLRRQGKRVLVTREPGGTPSAERIRSLILARGRRIDPLAELFLYEAARAQHVAEKILPRIARGWIVICDRFTDATMAYQGNGRGLPRSTIATLNSIATGGLTPDLTIYLDIPPLLGLRRARSRGRPADRIESAGTAFHHRVRRGYLAAARAEPRRIITLSGRASPDAIHGRIRDAVAERMK